MQTVQQKTHIMPNQQSFAPKHILLMILWDKRTSNEQSTIEYVLSQKF